MKKELLSKNDLQLVKAAEDTIKTHFLEDWHHVAVACRGKSGKIYSAVNMDTYVSSMAVCAEPIAIGQAVLENDLPIDTIVAVRCPRPERENQSIKVVSPCGKCREMIADYSPNAHIILRHDESLFKANIQDILPFKYSSDKDKTKRHETK